MIDIEDLSREMGKPVHNANKFYNELFRLILEETRDPMLNTIHLQDFGKFHVKKTTIDYVIRALIAKIRKGIDVEENKESISLNSSL